MVLVSRSRAARVGEIEPVRPAKEKIEGDWHHWHRHPDDVQFGVINLSDGIFVKINSTGHYTHIPYLSSLALMVSTRSRSSQISGTWPSQKNHTAILHTCKSLAGPSSSSGMVGVSSCICPSVGCCTKNGYRINIAAM